ncbi:MAG: glycine oxidase ThiO [Acidobacteriota bacterium]|nr:glycine oxidase ThiO [Acidobacteriota bacterium]
MKESQGEADVIVIGGGVVGLAVAREIARRGRRVTIIEVGQHPGKESSHAAAGMLAPQAEADTDDSFFQLQRASRDIYPKFAEELRAETGRDIQLDQTGTLYLAFTDEDEQELERRYTWQTRAGLPIEHLSAQATRELEPSISPHVRGALRFPSDWQVETRHLVAALVAAVELFGVNLLTETGASGLRVGSTGHIEGVDTERGLLKAGAVVIAAGAWSSQIPFSITESAGRNSSASSMTPAPHPHVAPVRGQMLCYRQCSVVPFVRHVIYTPRGYIVPRRDGRILAGSTTEHVGYRSGVTVEGVRSIVAHSLEIAPSIAGLSFSESWSGLRPRAADEWPIIGASDEVRGLFYATGHYRNGILLSPLTGQLIADVIVDGRTPRLLEAFSPARLREMAYAVSHGE